MTSPDLFLLDPKNRAFVDGTASSPAPDPDLAGNIQLNYLWAWATATPGRHSSDDRVFG